MGSRRPKPKQSINFLNDCRDWTKEEFGNIVLGISQPSLPTMESPLPGLIIRPIMNWENLRFFKLLLKLRNLSKGNRKLKVRLKLNRPNEYRLGNFYCYWILAQYNIKLISKCFKYFLHLFLVFFFEETFFLNCFLTLLCFIFLSFCCAFLLNFCVFFCFWINLLFFFEYSGSSPISSNTSSKSFSSETYSDYYA